MIRDGVTHSSYLVYATWGWFLYGFGALLPQLGEDQGINRTVTSLHSVALATGALIAGFFAVPLVRALRRRGVFVVAGCLVAGGSLLLTAGGSLTAVTLAAALITGTGGSLMVNTIAPTLSDHHGGSGAAALAEGNAVAAGTGLVAPLLVGAGIAAGLTWRPAVLITMPLAIGVVLAMRRQPPGIPSLDVVLPPRAESRAALPAAVWPAVFLVVTCVAVEFCLASWSADLLRQRTGVSAGVAAAGVSAVIAGMTAGRLAIGRLALRHPPQRLLAGALLLTLAGWAVTWTATSAPLALAGLFVTGTGIAAQFPLGSSLVLAAATPPLRDRAAGVMSVGIGIASGGGPFAVGALADATSTHTAFVVVPMLLLIALAMLAGTRRGR